MQKKDSLNKSIMEYFKEMHSDTQSFLNSLKVLGLLTDSYKAYIHEEALPEYLINRDENMFFNYLKEMISLQEPKQLSWIKESHIELLLKHKKNNLINELLDINFNNDMTNGSVYSSFLKVIKKNKDLDLLRNFSKNHPSVLDNVEPKDIIPEVYISRNKLTILIGRPDLINGKKLSSII